ncbi:unnamed protein product [Colias eurytheme]|nr:unnamed protein product [Colias eurytheme]
MRARVLSYSECSCNDRDTKTRDMEVADQWRRQWAGKAEYGKVTEGGVTRRVARAMEVLHASAPGARVKVMRAAYHSTAGPGVPASSYLMQSSRRVITSGYNFSEPLSLPSKPLEVSSTPFESSPEVDVERLNYKVTEPDDIEISEPSKWRASTGKSSIRMPSEESSSADNASIIDLDSRNSSRNTFTKGFRDSEVNEENIKNIHKRNNRVSPLLDAPVTLSTLKYTSLLNGTDEWNNRRKSYSFEDTAPLNNNSYFSNYDTCIMDSSTDSGICKSTEIVNDHINHSEISSRRFSKERLSDLPEESFQDWLHKNRPNAIKSNRTSPLKDYHREYRPNESNISLQSKGKVTITLPIMVEDEDISTINKNDNDRKTKKVGFCKTELHFAAESGTVNIIATDEKGPPSNDFRKKRSVFVPYNNKIDKSITLFGDKSNVPELSANNDIGKSESMDFDENTAATKGILKNKIPKPKPYLLGENMELGISNIKDNKDNETTFPTAVSLINRNLEIEKRQSISNKILGRESNYILDDDLRTPSSGPLKAEYTFLEKTSTLTDNFDQNIHKQKLSDSAVLNRNRPLQQATTSKSKTRQLRDSDLTYFGIDTDKRSHHITDNLQEEIFHSVKLVQKISNSVCNSEAESDDNPEYQNISKITYSEVPIPKPRTKLLEIPENNQSRILNPILERENEVPHSHRRSRVKKTNDVISSINRSISEPPKRDSYNRRNIIAVKDSSPKRSVSSREHVLKNDKSKTTTQPKSNNKQVESIYVNIEAQKDNTLKSNSVKKLHEKRLSSSRKENTEGKVPDSSLKITGEKEPYGSIKNKQTKSEYRKPKRTEKLITPDLSHSRNEGFSPKERKIKTKNITNSTSSSYEQSSDPERTRRNLSGIGPAKETIKGHDKKGTIRSSKHILPTSTNSLSKPVKILSTDSTAREKSPLKTRPKELAPVADKNNSHSPSKTRRSKYVINYDDKNGTVSSICKINPSQDSLRKDYVPNHNRHTPSDNKAKSKVINKSGFLQIPEQQWISNEKKVHKHLNTKQKFRTHVQKSCQLL